MARDGVTAHLDGRWPQPTGATLLGRPLGTPAEDPTRGAVLARRYVRVLGAADDVAVRLQQVLRAAGWAPMPLGASLGDGAPWPMGLAVGSGAVEGAWKHVLQRRFTRAARRWKPPGFLHVLAWRLASLNGMFEAFWASWGLAVQASVAPTK